ncbi:MAG: glycosyltransferase family 39 protein [Vicinamibacterales bacterium]
MFIAGNLALLAWSGVKVGGDTGIYIDGATALLNGQPLTERQPSYLGYIAVVAAFQAIGAGLTGLVIAQVAAAVVAAVAVYRLALELGGRVAGGLAVVWFAFDINTNRWHAYILSDALFMSCLAGSAWLVHVATARPARWSRYAVASVAMVAAGLIRPEGWFVIPAAVLYWVALAEEAAGRKVAALGAGMAVCIGLYAVVAPRLGGNLQAVGPAEMLRSGQTIWEYDNWRVEMPDDPIWSSQTGSQAAVIYAVRHPISTAKLMGARLLVHTVHVRPYYSRAHNLVIAAWLLPLYAAAVAGAWALRRHPLLWWCGLVLATQSLVVALTHADWDGRYLAHVMPLVYPFASCGLAVLLRQALPAVHDRLAAA